MFTQIVCIAALALVSQCADCEKDKSAAPTPVEPVNYEFLISRGTDDFTPAVSGATFAISRLEKREIEIELVFRVGKRYSFSILTDETTIDVKPSWGFDEQTIFYDSNRNGKVGIWSINLTENTPKPVVVPQDSGMCFSAAVSPSKTMLAFTKTKATNISWWSFYISPPVDGMRPEYVQIITKDLKTGEEKSIAYGMMPAWSPDGQKLAYSFFNGTDWDLWFIEVRTGRKIRLTDSPENDFYPVFSPDGSKIAFTRLDTEMKNSDIFAVNTDASALYRITATSAYSEGGPFWTSDGIYIHTDTGPNTPFDIALIHDDVVRSILSPTKATADKPVARKSENPTSAPATKNTAKNEKSVDENSTGTVQVLNSTTKGGVAAKVAEQLETEGFSCKNIANSQKERNLTTGKIYYKPGFASTAQRIAKIAPGKFTLHESQSFDYDITIVLGKSNIPK